MSKYYENLEVNVEAIYNAIRSLDSEYEGKNKSGAPENYFTGEAIDKAIELDYKMQKLSYSDKENLATKIDDAVLKLNNGYATAIMSAFYDSVHYFVPSTITSYKVKNYKRSK